MTGRGEPGREAGRALDVGVGVTTQGWVAREREEEQRGGIESFRRQKLLERYYVKWPSEKSSDFSFGCCNTSFPTRPGLSFFEINSEADGDLILCPPKPLCFFLCLGSRWGEGENLCPSPPETPLLDPIVMPQQDLHSSKPSHTHIFCFLFSF